MPTRKNPCTACKGRLSPDSSYRPHQLRFADEHRTEKHLKCSDDTPRCRRCQVRDLECVRPAKRKAFRHGSTANYTSRFPDAQSWVNSAAREFRLQTHSRGPVRRIATERPGQDEPASDASPPGSGQHILLPGGTASTPQGATSPIGAASTQTPSSLNVVVSTPSNSAGSIILRNTVYESDPADATRGGQYPSSDVSLPHQASHWGGLTYTAAIDEPPPNFNRVQEACLLKHFIDELSHWFDICDPLRRFELLVPERARQYPPLLNAIYAVSARHMYRQAHHRTREGIVYKGKLLRHMTPETAVEYMLRCMPALREFHHTDDEETRELMVTTAVILRQFEEMEDEYEDDDTRRTSLAASIPGRVNFLSIINAVLKTSNSETFFKNSDLLKASYWVVLRQEVYYALRKGYAPEMVEAPQHWDEISSANRLVVHTSQVAKWLFDGKPEDGWLSLKEQEKSLEREVSGEFEPALSLPPDKEKGEVFPTIWFRSPAALTGMQHLMIARMILLAESPFIGHESDVRAAYRSVEGQVRSIVLDICGSALDHPQTPPALVNAVLAVHLYGHFFVDEYERRALVGIVRRFRDVQAWPVPGTLQGFN